VKRIEKAILFGLIPGIAGGYLVSRLLRPSPAARGLGLMMGEGPPARPAPAADDLEIVVGIGPVYARRLNEAGVRTFADLAATSSERLLEIVRASPGLADPDSWREQAARLMRKGQ
jgi:hypothetical protein